MCQTLSSRNTRQGTNYILGTEIVLRQTGHKGKLIKPKKQVLRRQITKLGSTGEKSCPDGEIKIDHWGPTDATVHGGQLPHNASSRADVNIAKSFLGTSRRARALAASHGGACRRH